MKFNKILANGKRTERFILYLSIGLLFLISFVYFYWFGNGIFIYQENQSLFIFSNEYLQKFTVKPGGLLEYTGNFITQGYYFCTYGSLIVSSLPVLLYAIFIKIIKQLSVTRPFWLVLILVPSCLLLLTQTGYEHYIHHSLGLILATLWFWISIVSGDRRFRFFVLALFPVFYYLVGSFALIYIVLYMMYGIIYEKGAFRYLLPAFLIVNACLTFILFKEILFLQPVDRLLKYPLNITDIPKVSMLFQLLGVYLIIFPLIIKGLDSCKVTTLSAIFIPVITIIIVFPLTICLLIKQYDYGLANLMQLEKSLFEQKWDEIIKQHESNPSTNVIGQYYYNLALSDKGKLCDRMFFGHQDFGTKSLTLPRDRKHINKSVYFYYTIGLISEAHHLAYESMVVYGYLPENIKLLIKTELIKGNYKVAERYINVLKKTLNYRGWARKYGKMLCNPEMINSDPELGEKIRLLPQGDFFVSSNDVQNIDLVLMGNPDNKIAFEYKIARMLLEKDFKSAVYQVKKMKDMNYTIIPAHIEEAIVLFINLNLELPYLGGLTINPKTWIRFRQYEKNFGLTNDGNKLHFEKKMKKEWGKTFWYYFQFK